MNLPKYRLPNHRALCPFFAAQTSVFRLLSAFSGIHFPFHPFSKIDQLGWRPVAPSPPFFTLTRFYITCSSTNLADEHLFDSIVLGPFWAPHKKKRSLRKRASLKCTLSPPAPYPGNLTLSRPFSIECLGWGASTLWALSQGTPSTESHQPPTFGETNAC